MTEIPRDTSAISTTRTLPTTGSVVPDLIGLDLAEALAAAAWAGTRLNVTRVVRTRQPWGCVVAQSPSPGTRMQQLWCIHVLVSDPPPSGEIHHPGAGR